MRRRRVLLAAAILAAGCGETPESGTSKADASSNTGDEDAMPVPDDPAAYYGPCEDNEWCGMGLGLTLNALPGS